MPSPQWFQYLRDCKSLGQGYRSCMKSFSILVAIALITAGMGCGEKEKPVKKVDIDNNSSGNPLTAPVDYLGAVNKARKTAIKTLDIASLKQTIQTFQANEDRFPKSLDELVSMRYLSVIPALPTGMRYNYNPANGVVTVVK